MKFLIADGMGKDCSLQRDYYGALLSYKGGHLLLCRGSSSCPLYFQYMHDSAPQKKKVYIVQSIPLD